MCGGAFSPAQTSRARLEVVTSLPCSSAAGELYTRCVQCRIARVRILHMHDYRVGIQGQVSSRLANPEEISDIKRCASQNAFPRPSVCFTEYYIYQHRFSFFFFVGSN